MAAKVTARVTVAVDVSLSAPWGDNVTAGQVFAQAKSEAEQRVRAALGKEPTALSARALKVTAVIVEQEES